MKVKVRKTGEVIEVTDYGEKFHPRFWSDSTGYYADELEFEPKELVLDTVTIPIQEALDWTLHKKTLREELVEEAWNRFKAENPEKAEKYIDTWTGELIEIETYTANEIFRIQLYTEAPEICSLCGAEATCECTACGKPFCEECHGIHYCDVK